MATLSAHRVNLIFDIGANTGEFGRSLRGWGYHERIVSFEPLSSAWEGLRDAAQGDPLWDVAPRAAIGAEDGEIDFHIAGNSYSSSALKMLDAHVTIAPESAYIGSESVPLRRLDTVGGSYLQPDSVLFIKADVQGFEGDVLKGAGELLKRAVGLHLELSLVPLYEGQCKYDEMIAELKRNGFEMWGVGPELVDPQSGRLLQINATFFRD
jgi:FkbM family methyltransferase